MQSNQILGNRRSSVTEIKGEGSLQGRVKKIHAVLLSESATLAHVRMWSYRWCQCIEGRKSGFQDRNGFAQILVTFVFDGLSCGGLFVGHCFVCFYDLNINKIKQTKPKQVKRKTLDTTGAQFWSLGGPFEVLTLVTADVPMSNAACCGCNTRVKSYSWWPGICYSRGGDCTIRCNCYPLDKPFSVDRAYLLFGEYVSCLLFGCWFFKQLTPKLKNSGSRSDKDEKNLCTFYSKGLTLVITPVCAAHRWRKTNERARKGKNMTSKETRGWRLLQSSQTQRAHFPADDWLSTTHLPACNPCETKCLPAGFFQLQCCWLQCRRWKCWIHNFILWIIGVCSSICSQYIAIE